MLPSDEFVNNSTNLLIYTNRKIATPSLPLEAVEIKKLISAGT